MNHHHRHMGSPLDPADPFNVAMHEWLDNGSSLPESKVTAPVAPVYFSVEQAIYDAGKHTTCTPDNRDFSILIHVVGTDGSPVIRSLEPEHRLMCVLGVLASDPDVAEAWVMGIDGMTYDPPAGTTRWLPIVNEDPNPDEPENPAA